LSHFRHEELSRFERLLNLLTRVRPGEGRAVALFFTHGLLLMVAYYIVKALRESFMLSQHTAEVRAYAVAVIALVLMLLVPLYSAIRRRLDGVRLINAVTLFFVLNMLAFLPLAATDLKLGFVFFVWVAIFGVVVVSQFWALAADSLNLKSGQRLFPAIMVGVNLGALVGAKLAEISANTLGTTGLMLFGAGALATTMLLAGRARDAVPEGSRPVAVRTEIEQPHLLGGFRLVFRDRYLSLVALLVVVLNWVNTTGEFVLADFVKRTAQQLFAGGQIADIGVFITSFYGEFFFWVTLIGLMLQLFLVSRIYRLVGVRGAILVLPIVAVIGYGLLIFVPIFTIVRLVKIVENSVDYSIMATTRHALFLPTDRAAKYEAKTAIDTFFWRFGDLIQAGAVFVGLNVLGWGTIEFAALNLVLALVWLRIAWAIGRRYVDLARENVINVAPEAFTPIPTLEWLPGESFRHLVPHDAFRDADPGDVLSLSARRADGQPLPAWMRFDPRRREFLGVAPAQTVETFSVEVIASDVDGFEARSLFVVRHYGRSD
jgi:AAA family ATP:ADP antiporter